MPVEFLGDEQVAVFGRFVGAASERDLARLCWFDDAALDLIGRHRRDVNRLGFAVQLATVRMLGTFLPDPTDVPDAVVDFVADFVADQVGVADRSMLAGYLERDKTRYEHQWEITEAFSYRPWSDPGAQLQVRVFIASRAWTSPEGPTALFERTVVWLREHKVLLPGVSVLARLVSEVRTERAERLYREVIVIAGPEMAAGLDGLLDVAADSRVSELERLRTRPAQTSIADLVHHVDRFLEIRDLGVGRLDLSSLPTGRIVGLARYGTISKAGALRDLSEVRRRATLIATVWVVTADAADDVCDAFDTRMSDRVVRKAARDTRVSRLRFLPRLLRAALRLARAARVLLAVINDSDIVGGDVRAALVRRLDLDELEAAAVTIEQGALADNDGDLASEMTRRFSTVRAVLTVLAGADLFDATPAGAAVLDAVTDLPGLLEQRTIRPEMVDTSLLSPAWEQLVTDGNQIDRRAYTVAVGEALHRALRRRDV